MVSGFYIFYFLEASFFFFFGFSIAFVVVVFFLFQNCIIFIWLVLLCHMERGIFLDEGLDLSPLHWERRVFTTELLGKFLVVFL